MLNMQVPSTERNQMPQMVHPGSVYVPPPMPRSASPQRQQPQQQPQQQPYWDPNQSMIQENSPARDIPRSPCLSPAAEHAMRSTNRRGNSVGPAGKTRRGSNSLVNRKALYEPLPTPVMQVRAPPARRHLDLPPSESTIAEQPCPDGTTREPQAHTTVDAANAAPQGVTPEVIRDPLDCVAPVGILPQATRDPLDCVNANAQPGSPAPSNIFTVGDGSDSASRTSAQGAHQTPGVMPLPNGSLTPTKAAAEGGRPPTPPPTRQTTHLEEGFIPEDVAILNFVEIEVPNYLMAGTDLGHVSHTLAEVNRIYDAFAYRFQGVGPGSLPPPRPIVHQIYTNVYSKINRWVERNRNANELSLRMESTVEKRNCRI